MAFPSSVRARSAPPGVLAAVAVRCFLSLAAFAAPTAAQDPFVPSVRWTQAYDAAAPAVPRAVAFVADENAAVAAWSGANPAFSAASAHASGPNAPLGRRLADPASTGSIGIAAGSGPFLFTLAQVPAPDPLHRRTVVRASSIDDATTGLAERWSREFPFTANGAARIACDANGASAWIAAFDDTAQRVRLERVDGATGALQFARELDALALGELVVAADGSRAALAAGLDVFVIDAQGNTLHHAVLTATTTALALAGDGRALVHGAPGMLRVLRDDGVGYASQPALLANAGEIATRAALDGDGSTLAVAWWSANTGTSWRFEVSDLAHMIRLEERAFVGVQGGLQDLPTAVAITPDGARVAFACWGTNSSTPEAGIWDRASATYVLEADLPGSAFALALDSTGTRALVAAKSTHANVLSSTGSVRLLDTGERDLQVIEAPLAGGVLHLTARAAGASAVLFLAGDPAPTPFRVPGTLGQMRLRRVGLGVARISADATGRADWTTAIPAAPALVGTVKSFQAAFRSAGGTTLGQTLLHLRIL